MKDNRELAAEVAKTLLEDIKNAAASESGTGSLAALAQAYSTVVHAMPKAEGSSTPTVEHMGVR